MEIDLINLGLNMAIELTDLELEELTAQAQRRGEPVYQPTALGTQLNLPQCLGSGGDLNFTLRHGLNLEIRKATLKQPLRQRRQHEASFPLTSKFYLAGASRVQTLDASDIDNDYQETVGHHYLYHLPNHTEIEHWPAHQLIHIVTVSADATYLNSLHGSHSALPPPLQKLLQGDAHQRFHQPLGHITPAMWQLVQQILGCPHDGLMQQLYLESKVLELLTLQLSAWTNEQKTPTPVKLCSQDIEQLYQAQASLIQQATDPPSLKTLARQVGLNERKLKHGFRQLFGTTVFGYLQDHRMHQAQTLLQDDSSLTIAGVAAAVGYKSPEAFSTAFRRKFAVSPKAYQLGRRG